MGNYTCCYPISWFRKSTIFLGMMTSGRDIKEQLTSQRKMKDTWLFKKVQANLSKEDMIFDFTCIEMFSEKEALRGNGQGLGGDQWQEVWAMAAMGCFLGHGSLEGPSTRLSPAHLSRHTASPETHEQTQPRSAGPLSPSQHQPASSRH